MILLSDANILIDLGYIGGLQLLPQLAPTEVLDVVLLECEHPSQATLVQDIQLAGITTVPTEPSWVQAARPYRSRALSLQDCLNLFYALTRGRVLLAGDKLLRDHCVTHGVSVHGSIWLVEQAHNRRLVARSELCRWLRIWPRIGRRLPKSELDRLQKQLECDQ